MKGKWYIMLTKYFQVWNQIAKTIKSELKVCRDICNSYLLTC